VLQSCSCSCNGCLKLAHFDVLPHFICFFTLKPRAVSALQYRSLSTIHNRCRQHNVFGSRLLLLQDVSSPSWSDTLRASPVDFRVPWDDAKQSHCNAIRLHGFAGTDTCKHSNCIVISDIYIKKLSRCRHLGSNGERNYSSYSFLTSALDGVVSVTPRPRFTPGKVPPVPTG
jgi:hypothetical protein